MLISSWLNVSQASGSFSESSSTVGVPASRDEAGAVEGDWVNIPSCNQFCGLAGGALLVYYGAKMPPFAFTLSLPPELASGRRAVSKLLRAEQTEY